MKDYCTLPLGGSGKVALVDRADFPRLNQFTWRLFQGQARRNCYVGGRRTTQQLSHAVLNLRHTAAKSEPRIEVKNLNGNKLDCRRENLRVAAWCSVRQIGRQSFEVRTKIDGINYHVGCWPSAARAEEMRETVSALIVSLRGRNLTRRQIQSALDGATGRTARRYGSDAAARDLMLYATSRIPAHLPADVREEAAQAIAVDLLAGQIARDDLSPPAVRRYVSDAYGLQGYRFRSLDAPVRDGDGRTLGELLAA
jgi:hypothetical protein